MSKDLLTKIENEMEEKLFNSKAKQDQLKLEWKDVYIDGKKLPYRVNNIGGVIIESTKKMVHQRHDEDGYCFMRYIDSDGINKKLFIHRLVAQAFIPNPENKPQVNHIDCDKDNNAVSNLEWVTAKENIEHSINHGLNGFKGELNHTSLYTNEQIEEVCKMIQDGYSPIEIENKTSVRRVTINAIKAGNSWTLISEKYNFPDIEFNYGENHHNSRFTEDDVRYICELLEKGVPCNRIANELGTSKCTIDCIRKGITWKNISKDYNFYKGKYGKHGSESVLSKYTDRQIKKVCEMLSDKNYSFKDIREKTNVRHDTINKIYKGKAWTHISKDYNFASDNDRKSSREANPIRVKAFELFNNGFGPKYVADEIFKEYSENYSFNFDKCYSSIRRMKHEYNNLHSTTIDQSCNVA